MPTTTLGPLGFPMADAAAMALDAVLKTLPRTAQYEYRKSLLTSAPTELNPGERSDVSWISTESIDRMGEVVVARGMNDSQFQGNPLVTLGHAYDMPPARALSVCDWMNDHSDYTYLHQYGDKDTYHLAWRGTATPYVIAPTVQWHDVAFLQRDLEGGTLFVHRCRDKFRLGTHGYCTAQRADANVWSAGLPHEAYCHRVLGELDRLLNPEKEFQLRPGTWDKDIWHHITILNEYRLPERFADEDVIVDIGGHVGSFVHAVLSRGAGRVIVVEPDPENLALLRANVARYGDRVKIHAGAAWRRDVEYPATLPLDSPPEWANTGARACGLSTVKPGAGESLTVQALSFDDLLEQAGPTIRLLKLDCEGSEFPILFTSRLLHRVQEIAGEYHEIGIIPAHARVRGQPRFTAQALADHLEKQGFSVTLVPTGPEVGLFFALALARRL